MDENKQVETTNVETQEEKELTFQELLDNNKKYQAEFDKRVQKALTTAKTKWEEEKPNTDVKDSEHDTDLKKELEALKQQIADKEKKEQEIAKDNALTKDIMEVFGDKEFINEYTKTAIMNEIKAVYNSEDNVKSVNDIFKEVIKDKNDIFTNPNQVQDMPSIEDSEERNETKQMPELW